MVGISLQGSSRLIADIQQQKANDIIRPTPAVQGSVGSRAGIKWSSPSARLRTDGRSAIAVIRTAMMMPHYKL